MSDTQASLHPARAHPTSFSGLEGAGATAPIASHDSNRGREQNRRVDVYIVRR